MVETEDLDLHRRGDGGGASLVPFCRVQPPLSASVSSAGGWRIDN
jgi:hypothetical protein